MTACMQPGCTGTIDDGYCDVCGSPAEAVPFVPTAAAASTASAVEAQLGFVSGGSGVTTKSSSALLSGCMQPGCAGTILDGYCDVCGSPADAVPFVSAAASAASPTDDDTGNVDGEDELAEGQSGAQYYRRRVEEAHLPDEVREAALCEVGKLERTIAQSAECREIRTWLDTILDLPWTTKITESIDIHGSREVEATLRRLIEPTVADPQMGDTVEIEPVVVDIEEGDAGEIEPLPIDVEEGDAAGVEPAAVDVEEDDSGEAGPVDAEVKENDTAEIEQLAVDLEDGDATEAEPPAVDVDEDDTAGSERLAVDVEAAGLEPSAVDIEEGNATEADAPAVDVKEGDTPEIERLTVDAKEDDTGEAGPAVVAEVKEDNTAEAKPLAVDVEQAEATEAEPPAVDVDEDDTGDAGPAVVAEVKGDGTAEVEPSAVDVVRADTTEAEPLAVDVEEDAAEVEPSAVDVEQADATEADAPAVDGKEGDTGEAGPAVVADVKGDGTAEVEPSAVDVVQADTTEAELPAVDVEKADTAAGDLEHDDPVKMPAPAGVLSEDRHTRPQVPKQQVLEPEPVQIPAKRRGFVYVAVAATALAAMLIGALLFTVSRDRGVTAQSGPAVTATATASVTNPTTGPSNGSTNTVGEEPTIQLENLPETATSSQTVRIEGRYRGGPDTFVQAQCWEGGKWLDFPVPAKTDKSGRFTTFIDIGDTGRYPVRVVDPHSGVKSKTFVLVVTG